MATIDPDAERQRLADFYSHQLDGELEKIALDENQLTPLARDVLMQELARRGLVVQPESNKFAEAVPGTDATDTFVVVQKFRDLPQALLAKGSLESAGVESFLADDNTVRMDWLCSNLLGSIKLLVRQEDLPAAMEILGGPIPAVLDLDGAEAYEQPRCPTCESLDVSFEELYKPIAFPSLFVNFPLPIHRRGWHCHSCNTTRDSGHSS